MDSLFESGGELALTATRKALGAGDILGRRPLHHAAIRYGTGLDATVPVYQALFEMGRRVLAAIKQPADDAAILAALCPPDLLGNTCATYATVSLPRADVVLTVKSRADDQGGWPRSSYGAAQFEVSPPGRCNVAQLAQDSPWSLQSLQKALTPYMRTLTPVVVRSGGMLFEDLRRNLARDALSRNFGEREVRVGAIPYYRTFHVKGDTMPMADFIESIVDLAGEHAGPSEPPPYLFEAEFVAANPDFLEGVRSIADVVQGMDGVEVGNREAPRVQFYLGATGTGAPWHFHNAAFNALAYGRKRWLILPPGDSLYSAEPVMEYLQGDDYARRVADHSDGAASTVPRPIPPLEFVQEAGDLVYIPMGWSHSTVNIEASVGVAMEGFNLRGNQVLLRV
jgi:hypothetical protein